jgi:uncharacterized protein (TIGR02271 family)
MPGKLVVGLLDTRAEAQDGSRALACECGVDAADVAIVVHDDAGGERLVDSLAKLGVPAGEVDFFAEHLRAGAALVVVRTPSEETASCAAALLQRCIPQDDALLPVAEETLAVGKHEVSLGKTRVRAGVAEEPVEEGIRLREERASIERRPVDRLVGAGDEVFKDLTIEILETAEEAVVEKRRRVVEEIVIGKEVVERDETIRDTVRHTEVDIEREAANSSQYGGPERRRLQLAYPGPERRGVA